MNILQFTANNADRRLLTLYPRWRAAMKKWDAAQDRTDACPVDQAPRSSKACCKAAQRALETVQDEIDAITEHGAIGAIVKLTIHRTLARLEEDQHEDAFREIATLARAMGLEPYDYVSTTNLSEAA